MTRDEDEAGLLVITTVVEFLELMVLMRGIDSSFGMYDQNDDDYIDVYEAAEGGFAASFDDYKGTDELWDIEEYVDYVAEDLEGA